MRFLDDNKTARYRSSSEKRICNTRLLLDHIEPHNDQRAKSILVRVLLHIWQASLAAVCLESEKINTFSGRGGAPDFVAGAGLGGCTCELLLN